MSATANEIRSAFLNYFGRNGHEVVPSSPLVPRNDPTLMFTTAGMVQFKDIFTGKETRRYTRAATAQKCVRAGGKHNDLENVGRTARHHTFFEMLGNFSFGDYFKDEAITLAWNLITKEYGLAKDKLLVTVYHDDDQAFNIWKKLTGFSDDRIIRIPTSDNFWSMGDTGPCGPCSEIFYDHGPKIAGGPPGSADQDGDRYLEFWNLVFMQYEQRGPGDRVALPKPSIDTGMGLERLTAVLQGKHDNYDTDQIRAIIEAAADLVHDNPDGKHRISFRVMADHLRASCFLIADGVLPSNEGRGYVLRRIMRRAMRHAHLAGSREPLMYRLVPTLIQQMGGAYPELVRAQALITETLKLEETRFRQTLERGLKLLDEETGKLKAGQPLSGDVAFKLYDTFGFPLDLTEDVLKGQQRTVDHAAFDKAMERQRAEARKAWTGSGEAATEKVWFEIQDKVGATDFLGYATEKAEGQVTALVVKGQQVSEAKQGTEVMLVANQTPFYGESGGQVGDTGVITTVNGAVVRVTDTLKKLGTIHAHVGVVEKGTVKVGDAVTLEADGERRSDIRANHSATHLLHEALRRRLGEHVAQKGSLVAPDRLRFDFSHPKALLADDIRAIEADVNHHIRLNEEVLTRLMTPDQAIAEGAMALFGEKYGEEVRVVSMGAHDDDGHFSTELCGGTHVRRTGDIGSFKIISESAVAGGVRRLEALTGRGVLRYLDQQEDLLVQVAGVLKTTVAEAPARVTALLDERKKTERELSDLRRQMALSGGGSKVSAEKPTAKQVNGVNFLGRVLDGVSAKDLKPLADDMKKQIGSGVVALIAVDDGKASLVVGVTDDLTQRLSAVDLVKAGAETLGGKGGGGRPDMAQAGGPDGAKAQDALKAIEGKIG
ncbi:MAG: alanine--tRNA ligase [Pseudomonadota bacterium]|nr:alanine--tRNA ligase [Pseudomonadota bacterium]